MELSNTSLPKLMTTSQNSSNQLSTSHSYAPLCRQFWKAGEYSAGDASGSVLKSGQNNMRIHPKFLHSNATSHKWAFGAIAELLDNAVDEACSGATTVIVDRISKLGSSDGLLIQDDGGGMDPQSIRHCMSFGFSDKESTSAIGEYGNGFKTSTMRLGADVIVFSRCLKEKTLTQSVGILSYTFLRQTCCNDVIVPMVDYIFDPLTRGFVKLIRRSEKYFCDNLSILLRWSPFSKEEELLNQFNHIGRSGARIIVFNLWQNDNGDPELDFETNEKDILVRGAHNMMPKFRFAKDLNEQHIGNRFHYSLRAYSSILYLRLPENFRILLRGNLVSPHYIAEDLVYTQCIKYKPQVASIAEFEEIGTVIGFLSGAPNLDIHGFNIYHRNRLIMPFWRAANKCKGVVGVLQVGCLKPTHEKQDFERSDIFLKLEMRLKSMALEYWRYHCHLVGYTATKFSNSIELPNGYQMYHPDVTDSTYESFHKRKRKRTQEAEMSSYQLSHRESQDCTHSIPINHHSRIIGVLDITAIGEASQAPSRYDNVSHSPPGFTGCGKFHGAVSQSPSGYDNVSHSPPRFTRGEKFHVNCGGSPQAELHENGNFEYNIATEADKELLVTGRIAPTLKINFHPQMQQLGSRDRRQAVLIMLKRRKQLIEQCGVLENSVEQLALKEKTLRSELEVVELVCKNLHTEIDSFGQVKMDKL